MIIKYLTYGTFDASFYFYKWGFAAMLLGVNLKKTPLPKRLPLLFYLSIGFDRTVDPNFTPRSFIIAFDCLNFKHRDGDEARFILKIKPK